MSDQSAIAFAERLRSDEAFRSRLEAAPDRAAWETIAREAGYDVGAEDLPAIKAALGFDELSDEDLERVAGVGGGTETPHDGGPTTTGIIPITPFVRG